MPFSLKRKAQAQAPDERLRHELTLKKDENTMVEEMKAQREHEPEGMAWQFTHQQIEAYIRTMVRCEKLAAEKLQWSEQEWATHCLHQKAEAERREAEKLKWGYDNG